VKIFTAVFSFLFASLISLPAFAAKETRTPGPFNELKVYGRFDVVLVKGTQESVSLESEETPLENVLTEVEEGKLKVRMKTNYFKNTEVKVIITFRQLHEISAGAGAVIDAGTVESKNFSLEASSGAEIKAEVVADTLETEVTQGASLTLSGSANYHDAQVSTGGQLTALLLNCNSVKARVTMGGYAKVHVKERIEASVNMGGNITYKGTPKEVKQSTSMGGSITQLRE